MTQPNANVQKELDAQRAAFELGIDDGYSTEPLPDWYATTAPKYQTTYQQDYCLGRGLLRLEQMQNGPLTTTVQRAMAVTA